MTRNNGTRRTPKGTSMHQLLASLQGEPVTLVIDDDRERVTVAGVVIEVGSMVVLKTPRRYALGPDAEGKPRQVAIPEQVHFFRIEHVKRFLINTETPDDAAKKLGEPPPIPLAVIAEADRMIANAGKG